ncbi:MAG: RNA polymerase sigma factor [Pirellulaceae bacterium]
MASSDAQLTADIRAAIGGDTEVWQRLLETYRPAFERWAESFSHDSELSQADLVQEAWLRVYRGLSGFRGVEQTDGVPAAFYVWLRTTARNAMLAKWRARNANRRIPDDQKTNGQFSLLADPNTHTPSSIVAHNEELSHLHNAISQLDDPMDRQIIGMVFEDGLSLRSVSRLLDMEYTTLRRRFHRLLGQLASGLTSDQ